MLWRHRWRPGVQWFESPASQTTSRRKIHPQSDAFTRTGRLEDDHSVLVVPRFRTSTLKVRLHLYAASHSRIRFRRAASSRLETPPQRLDVDIDVHICHGRSDQLNGNEQLFSRWRSVVSYDWVTTEKVHTLIDWLIGWLRVTDCSNSENLRAQESVKGTKWPRSIAKCGFTILDGNNELWVDVGESGELSLVQVHDEEFVRWRQFWSLAGELTIKVTDVFQRFLQLSKEYVCKTDL